MVAGRQAVDQSSRRFQDRLESTRQVSLKADQHAVPTVQPASKVSTILNHIFVRECVLFKIAGLVHQSLVGAAPAYLADDCRLLSDVGRRPLRSNSNDVRKLLVPRTHTCNKLGDRSFSAAGPRLWNDLPPGLRRPGLSFDFFRQSLKTHLFGVFEYTSTTEFSDSFF